MTAYKNPFEYSGANDLPREMILDYYIEDFNYSRFIRSKRNVILVGERGCGKSMALLYNSLPVRFLKAKKDSGEDNPLNLAGIYIPCHTPLSHKKEYELLQDIEANAISEHFFVLSIVYNIAKTLSETDGLPEIPEDELKTLRTEIGFLLDCELNNDISLFEWIKIYIQKIIRDTERHIVNPNNTSVRYDETFSFSSMVQPILSLLRQTTVYKNTHFMLMIDDAHMLNKYQMRTLSSWIAYREHSLFSFKIAIANLTSSSLKTTSGGSILEGHDFTRLSMVQPYHNELSDFGRLANEIIQRRLTKFGIETDGENFFPVSEAFTVALNESKSLVKEEAVSLFGDDKKKINDYVYKYSRAHYFKNRPAHANRPEYSGIETIIYISTGVVRNLLIPCFWMYEKMISREGDAWHRNTGTPKIPPNIQSETILERSRAEWDFLRSELDQIIDGCSHQDMKYAYNLLDNLAILFTKRLKTHKSEPRANSFTISEQTDEVMIKLNKIISILREAQLLYIRSGSGKDEGKRELYYVPNRMLWPERGLDPHGQHARVSIKANDLWVATSEGKEIPYDEKQSSQGILF